MRLNDGFLTYDSGDNHYMVSTSNTKFNGIVNSNETASYIINLLKEDISFEEIVAKLLKEYDVDKVTLEKDVTNILDELRQIGALDE